VEKISWPERAELVTFFAELSPAEPSRSEKSELSSIPKKTYFSKLKMILKEDQNTDKVLY
jgi:hypothetical protein